VALTRKPSCLKSAAIGAAEPRTTPR
jgi:hypothetical protein